MTWAGGLSITRLDGSSFDVWVVPMPVRGVCAANAKLRPENTTNGPKTCRKHGAKTPQKSTNPEKCFEGLQFFAIIRNCNNWRLDTFARIATTNVSYSWPLYHFKPKYARSRPHRAGFGSIRRSISQSMVFPEWFWVKWSIQSQIWSVGRRGLYRSNIQLNEMNRLRTIVLHTNNIEGFISKH